MDIKSIFEGVRRSINGGLFDLFSSTIKFDGGSDITFAEYIVMEEDEMRIDLVFQKMYELSPAEVGIYLGDIDVILRLNNIDNPLNIKKGMVLRYPELGSIGSFRFEKDEETKSNKKSLVQKLAKPNKQTKMDPNRKKYIDSDYSLPPTVNSSPKQPIIVEGNSFKIGGL
jgi:hypothetical protein